MGNMAALKNNMLPLQDSVQAGLNSLSDEGVPGGNMANPGSLAGLVQRVAGRAKEKMRKGKPQAPVTSPVSDIIGKGQYPTTGLEVEDMDRMRGMGMPWGNVPQPDRGPVSELVKPGSAATTAPVVEQPNPPVVRPRNAGVARPRAGRDFVTNNPGNVGTLPRRIQMF